MLGTDFAHLKRRAIANPSGPEALRLDWLQARGVGSPIRLLLELIGRYVDRGFSIPEIDAYIEQSLVRARERLRLAQQDGSMTARRLRLLERTVELAMTAQRTRPKAGNDPMLLHALAIAAELEEIRTH